MKLFIAINILLLSSNALGQRIINSYSVSSGVVSSNFHSSKGNLFRNNLDANISYYFAVGYGKSLNSKLSITTELRFIELGAKMTFNVVDTIQSKSFKVDKAQLLKFQSLQLPISLNYQLYNSNLNLTFGYVLGYIIQGKKYNNYLKNSIIISDEYSLNDDSNYPFINSKLIRINHAISLGLNYKLPLSPIIHANLNYVSNISKIYESDDLRNHYILIGLKYTFGTNVGSH